MYINNLNKFLIFFFLYCLIVNIGCNKDEFGDTPEVEAHDMNQETTNIQLEVSGLNNTNGQLAIAIFDNADSFEDENNAYKDSTVINTDNAKID